MTSNLKLHLKQFEDQQSSSALGARLDIMSALTEPPPSLDFIWPGFVAGTVGAIIGVGGVGKSIFSLQAAMSIAGADLLQIKPPRPGRVVYLAAEDPIQTLAHRIHSMGKTFTDIDFTTIVQNLVVHSCFGNRINVMNKNELNRLIDSCIDTRLIVLDTLSRFHCLDENNNSEMALLISTLEQLASATGAAVLFLHHASKSSAREGLTDRQHAARGASALIDNSRWCGYIAKMNDDEANRLIKATNAGRVIGNNTTELYVRFGVSKQNYDSAPLERWYERRDGGVLAPAQLLELSGSNRKKESHRGQA